MAGNIILSICAFINILILIIVFFSKKRLKIFENKIYASLIIVNFLNALLEILSYITLQSHISYNSFLYNFEMKFILSLYLSWILLFLLYIVTISLNIKNPKEKHIRKILKVCFIFYIILLLILFISPIKYNHKNNLYIPAGIGTNIVYTCSAISDLIMITMLIKNKKNMFNKKYIPLFILLILGIFTFIFQSINPEYFLLTPLLVLTTFIMYFTIENPDLKMIEQLNIARDQAEKANHAKSDFLSSMSHEIRTPLNAIVGFSQALTEEDLPSQAKDEVKDIMMASETLLEIVNGILDISKIEANKLEIVNTEYNINLILEELVSLTKARLGEKPLEFKYRFDPSIPPYLYGDKVRVKQIILNLLTNAVKYTKEGWISFEVNAIQKDGICRLIISVEDSGIGIKPESIDKLFTKFERLDIEKNNTIEGTGLGLAITKKLLDLMGGQVVVQSVYGQGSKFTVAIDQRIVTNPTTVVESTQVSVENLDLSTKKILVVDDNKINLKVAARLLSDYHCQIETLESGIECIDQIKAGNTYDLILMDDMMPKLSGVETFHQLQQIPGFSIPTIALTANAISGMKEKYLQEGFHDYLAKPIDKKELYTVLAKFLVQK